MMTDHESQSPAAATHRQELICIGCPMGCQLIVEWSEAGQDSSRVPGEQSGDSANVQPATEGRISQAALPAEQGTVAAASPGMRRISRISGYLCDRGKGYARDEIIEPRRMVTSLIPVQGRALPLSVRTRGPIPKNLIFACLRAIRQVTIQPPVHQGDCIIANVLNTGVDVIATRDVL